MKKIIILIAIIFTQCSLSKESFGAREFYYVESDNAQLPVVISGKNTSDVIVYVHGGPGSSALLYQYAPAWNTVKETYRMVFYDQRGSGGARGHASENSLSVDQHVKDLNVVVESVRLRDPNSRIFIFAHSYGGMIASAYASQYSSKLAGLILISPALNVPDLLVRVPTTMITKFIDPFLARPDLSSTQRREWENNKSFYIKNSTLSLNSFIQHSQIATAANSIQGFNQSSQYFQNALPQLLTDPLFEPIIWRTQIEKIIPVLNANGESQRNLETDPKFNISKITIPSILFVGNQDLIVPAESSIQAYSKIPQNTRIIRYDNAAHNSFLENTDQFVTDILSFLNSI